MKIISSGEQFNFINHGFMYLCRADDGSLWLRSTAGNWAQIKTSSPMQLEDLQQDFQMYLKMGVGVTENDIKVDDSSQVVVDPPSVAISTPEISPKI